MAISQVELYNNPCLVNALLDLLDIPSVPTMTSKYQWYAAIGTEGPVNGHKNSLKNIIKMAYSREAANNRESDPKAFKYKVDHKLFEGRLTACRVSGSSRHHLQLSMVL